MSALSVKVTSHNCDKSIIEKERSIQAVGHLKETEKKVESSKELNAVH